jgi:hypothetical protein
LSSHKIIVEVKCEKKLVEKNVGEHEIVGNNSKIRLINFKLIDLLNLLTRFSNSSDSSPIALKVQNFPHSHNHFH